MDAICGISESLLWLRARNFNVRFPGVLSAGDLRDIIVRDGPICCWCGKGDLRGRELTFEHLGHTNDVSTMTIACARCNYSHRAGAKRRSDLPAEVVLHREASRHKSWDREHREFVLALKREEYRRNIETRRRYVEANRERILADKRLYRQQKRASIAAYMDRWQADNRDRHAEQRKLWREANPDITKERWQKWYAENADKCKARASARWQRIHNDPTLRAARNAKKRAAYQQKKQQQS